jgi:hypothetical protein
VALPIKQVHLHKHPVGLSSRQVTIDMDGPLKVRDIKLAKRKGRVFHKDDMSYKI